MSGSAAFLRLQFVICVDEVEDVLLCFTEVKVVTGQYQNTFTSHTFKNELIIN